MPMFGPRLDRPSAVGEEGRPRATSLTVAGVVVAALAVAVGVAVGRPGLVPTAGLLVGGTAAGAALLDRDRVGPLVVGQLLFVPFASGLVAVVALAVAVPAMGALATGLLAAGLGVAVSWTDALDADHLRRLLSTTVLWYVSLFLAAVVLAFVGGGGAFLLGLLGAFVGGVGPSASAVGFLAAVAVAALAVHVALRVLPVVQLAPASRRGELDRRVDRYRRAATAASVAAVALAVVLVGLWLGGSLARLYAVAPGVAAAFRLLSSPFVAGPVVLVAVVGLLATALAVAARRLTGRLDPSSTREVAAVVAGGVSLLALLPLAAVLAPVLGAAGPLTVAGIALVMPIGVLLALGVGLAAVHVDLLPDRAGGPALAGAGLWLATLAAGLARLPAPLVFALAAGALVVWDVSSFGLGVTAELGHRPETRRLELFHGVVGVGLGVAAVVAASALHGLRVLGGLGVDAPWAAVLAVVGVLALSALLRG